jgi:xanthine phosphoribosyltransferase
MTKRVYYSYNEFKNDLKVLIELLEDYRPDIILSIARGGLTIGHMMGEALDIRRVYTVNSIHYDDTKKLNSIKIYNIPSLKSGEKILIVDDIVDSGDTATSILNLLKDKYPHNEYKLVSIFYKESASIKPDFAIREAKDWIDFFWSEDIKE